MANLLEETLRVLEQNGKSEKDIVWLGCDDFQITWDNFKEIAKNADYDKGYGSAKVAQDLKIAGNGFEMVRAEYDGSEWWDFRCSTDMPTKTIKITALTIDQAEENFRDVSCGWEDLAAMNGIELEEHEELEEEEEDYDELIQRQMMDDYNNQIGIGINNNK